LAPYIGETLRVENNRLHFFLGRRNRVGENQEILRNSMKRTRKLRKLTDLERQAQKLRDDLKISPANEVLFRAPQGTWSDNDIVVEAGGQGDATLLVVEGNYPIDYLIKSERHFASEAEACEAAWAMTA